MSLDKDPVDPGKSTSSQSWRIARKPTRRRLEDEGTFECAF